MSAKLLSDPKIAKLVERETSKAVKQDRKRIVAGLKELRADYAEDEDVDTYVKQARNQALTAANKIARDAA